MHFFWSWNHVKGLRAFDPGTCCIPMAWSWICMMHWNLNSTNSTSSSSIECHFRSASWAISSRQKDPKSHWCTVVIRGASSFKKYHMSRAHTNATYILDSRVAVVYYTIGWVHLVTCSLQSRLTREKKGIDILKFNTGSVNRAYSSIYMTQITTKFTSLYIYHRHIQDP